MPKMVLYPWSKDDIQRLLSSPCESPSSRTGYEDDITTVNPSIRPAAAED